jgi:hypothetical protein
MTNKSNVYSRKNLKSSELLIFCGVKNHVQNCERKSKVQETEQS